MKNPQHKINQAPEIDNAPQVLDPAEKALIALNGRRPRTQATDVVDGQAVLMSDAQVAVQDPTPEQEVAQQIVMAISDARNSLDTAVRKIVVTGVLMLEQKAVCKHGEFGPWLHKNCFPELSPEEFRNTWRTASRWMATAEAAVGLLQIGHDVQFAEMPLSQVLLSPASLLSHAAQELQSRLFEVISDKSASQLQLEWKAQKPAPAQERKEMSADEYIAARKKKAEDQIIQLTGDIQLFLNDADCMTFCDEYMADELLAAGIELNSRLRMMLAKSSELAQAKGKGKR